MKKLLLTLKKRNNSILHVLSFLLLFSFSNVLNAQVLPYGSLTDCSCLSAGQFQAKIFVNSLPGENWYLLSADGFYDIGQPSPLAVAEYPPLTPLVEVNPGEHTLTGIHLSDYLWSVEVTNGIETLTIMASHTCSYPDATIRGDKDVCIGNTEDYWINESLSNIVGPLNWTLSGGGSMSIYGNRVTVNWDDVPGEHTLSVTGTATTGCDIDEEVTIFIRNNDPIALACNGLVNLSMNTECEVQLTPDMFLKDMQLTSDAYAVQARHVEVDTIVPDGILDGRYIDVILEVTILHDCSGNSCWSNVKLEDKDIPNLLCPEPDTLECDETVTATLNSVPLSPGQTVTSDNNGGFILHGFDGCGDAYLTYEDEVVSESLCTGPFSSVIVRHWTAVDEAGNSTTCDNTIYIKRATVDDITFPGHWDDELGPNATIPACSGYPTLPNGHPDPSYTGTPQGTFCLNVDVSYTDVKLPICGDHSFKIVRKWKVVDLCSNTIEERNQNITVMDNAAPICVAPPEYGIGTSQNNCGSIIDVKPPLEVIECSDWDYYVSYKYRGADGEPIEYAITDDVTGSKASGYIIKNLPENQDTIWIFYNISDECGNYTVCSTEVGIVDDEQPVPVCDQYTFVGLNEDGFACVGPEAFDDGSWDNCGIDRIEVERMDGNPCGITCNTGLIGFCCDDVGETVMVRLTVWDNAGNSNNCMVEVEVQDNIAPVFTSCPSDRTISCGNLPISYSQYGTPTATDACDVHIEENVDENLNDCGVGVITRTFTATDDQGNEAICIQKLTVKNTNKVVKNNIQFPGNYTFQNGCSDTGAHPDDLPYPFNAPRITTKPCSDITVNHSDQVFQFADDACFKILRTWTVIDWCQYVPLPYDPPYDVPGKWTYEQVVKVMNTSAPMITKGCDNITIEGFPNDNCQLEIELTAIATDDCSSAENLIWSYEIDLNNDGSVNRTGTDNDASGLFPSGSHAVTWTVSDDCANVSSCTQIVKVEDDKNPTPYCYSGIVSVMPAEGTLAVWASDFDKGSFDNCPGDGNVHIAFSSNPSDTGRTYTCADLTSASDTFDIKMYVIDDEGNYDYCDTKFIVQDNSDVCPDTDTDAEGSILSLGGHIYTEDNEMMDNVEVLMLNGFTETTLHDMTEDGVFAFHDLDINTSYVINPSKDDNYMEGVSTLDLILIQRHILKLKKLDSPYKVIAADIDNSGRISALDLIHLRKLILGKYEELPNNDSWRFVDAEATFENDETPFPFAESVNLVDVNDHNMNNDFIAVKIGDVDNSLSLNGEGEEDASRNDNSINFTYEVENVNGLTMMNVFTTADLDNVEGFQTTLKFDPSKYEFDNITNGQLLLTNDNINIDLAERGLITLSYNEAVSINETNGHLFQLSFVSKTNSISGMEFSSDQVKSEIYTQEEGEIVVFKLGLESIVEEAIATGMELFQNVPNPFENSTTINFYIENDNNVSLKIFNLAGQVVYQTNKNFKAGMNNLDVDANDIKATGVLYYQVQTSTATLGSKMIIIK